MSLKIKNTAVSKHSKTWTTQQVEPFPTIPVYKPFFGKNKSLKHELDKALSGVNCIS